MQRLQDTAVINQDLEKSNKIKNVFISHTYMQLIVLWYIVIFLTKAALCTVYLIQVSDSLTHLPQKTPHNDSQVYKGNFWLLLHSDLPEA